MGWKGAWGPHIEGHTGVWTLLCTSMGVPKLLAREWDGKIWFQKEHSGGQDRRPEPKEEALPQWARLWVRREGVTWVQKGGSSSGVGSEWEGRIWAPLNFVPGLLGWSARPLRELGVWQVSFILRNTRMVYKNNTIHEENHQKTQIRYSTKPNTHSW